MNILRFLTPKQEVSFVYEDFSVEQALRVMERVRYTSIPIIRRSGQYVGTLTEGDLLWYLRSQEDGFSNTARIPLKKVPHHKDNKPLHASMDIHDLLDTAMGQNFAPVVDDRGMFIGIITRRKVIAYLREQAATQKAAKASVSEADQSQRKPVHIS